MYTIHKEISLHDIKISSDKKIFDFEESLIVEQIAYELTELNKNGESIINGISYTWEITRDLISSCYMIYQYDQWFSPDSKVLFGVFTDKTFEEVKEIAMNGFEELYKGFKDDVYSNGDNQWLTDKHDFGFSIEEIEQLNTFGEL